MRILLDTHALIWWWEDNPKLGARRDQIANRANDIWVSAVNAWEIANKVRLGRLPSMASRLVNYESWVVEDGFSQLAVDSGHAITAGMLEGAHRDPFDRLLAAQALVEKMTIMTRDPEFEMFGCDVLW